MRFTRIKLKNWRNFQSVDVEMQNRVFLIGPNASGKSNFLDAFRFLRDIASEGGGFQKAVQDRGGVSKIRCLAARSKPDISLVVELGNTPKKSDWTYELVFSQNSQRQPVIKQEIIKKEGIPILERPLPVDREDVDRLKQTHLEQVNSNREFRDIADFFTTIRYMHIIPQLIRTPERKGDSHVINDPFGRDFIERIVSTTSKTQMARMKKITTALKVAVPQLKELKVHKDDMGIPHLIGLFEHWRPKAGWQMEDQFSDGTLRLLGLLWSILDSKGPILLEEPELSLHTEVVRYIPQVFARLSVKTGKQIIVSTHSQELLSDEGIAADEAFILTPVYGGSEGTIVKRLKDDPELAEQINCGLTVADTAIPATAPRNASQLSLF